ncbi:hypothetical protein T09_14477 [Trichinella sp. T9]|nr:hypothetical protein T09_14477 [Trichinella sp. T9]
MKQNSNEIVIANEIAIANAIDDVNLIVNENVGFCYSFPSISYAYWHPDETDNEMIALEQFKRLKGYLSCLFFPSSLLTHIYTFSLDQAPRLVT